MPVKSCIIQICVVLNIKPCIISDENMKDKHKMCSFMLSSYKTKSVNVVTQVYIQLYPLSDVLLIHVSFLYGTDCTDCTCLGQRSEVAILNQACFMKTTTKIRLPVLQVIFKF